MRSIPFIRKLILEHGGSIIEEGDDGFAAQIRGLRFIASWGGGWDHVSVSLRDRCPVWSEMCFIKDLFWFPSECVVQYHPPKADYVNCHPNCLHMWRSQNVEFPRPPSLFVGVPGMTAKEAVAAGFGTAWKR